MAVHFYEEDRPVPVVQKRMRAAWLKKVVEGEGMDCGVIIIVFCSDSYLRSINQQFLNRDYDTDVISFPYNKGKKVGGDIIISWDRVKENAILYQVSDQQELDRVMVHGVLHLIGYSDVGKDEKERMSQLEDHYLERRNL